MEISIRGRNNFNKKENVMAKYKLQEMPDVHNTGKRKVYPKMESKLYKKV